MTSLQHLKAKGAIDVVSIVLTFVIIYDAIHMIQTLKNTLKEQSTIEIHETCRK